MKIIFLDIDGVLNVMNPERDVYGSLFHPQFVENLKRLVEETGAKIVISSTWRFSGLEWLSAMWLDREMPGQLLDITPFTASPELIERHYDPMMGGSERGYEIQQWLEDHVVDRYVIIDDDNDMLLTQNPSFVQTRDNWDHTDHVEGFGLTKECTDKAIKRLNYPL